MTPNAGCYDSDDYECFEKELVASHDARVHEHGAYDARVHEHEDSHKVRAEEPTKSDAVRIEEVIRSTPPPTLSAPDAVRIEELTAPATVRIEELNRSTPPPTLSASEAAPAHGTASAIVDTDEDEAPPSPPRDNDR